MVSQEKYYQSCGHPGKAGQSKINFSETQTIPHDLVVSHGGRIEVENQGPS
jgi:hypothetical protein